MKAHEKHGYFTTGPASYARLAETLELVVLVPAADARAFRRYVSHSTVGGRWYHFGEMGKQSILDSIKEYMV